MAWNPGAGHHRRDGQDAFRVEHRSEAFEVPDGVGRRPKNIEEHDDVDGTLPLLRLRRDPPRPAVHAIRRRRRSEVTLGRRRTPAALGGEVGNEGRPWAEDAQELSANEIATDRIE
jgi:hypothetical protein